MTYLALKGFEEVTMLMKEYATAEDLIKKCSTPGGYVLITIGKIGHMIGVTIKEDGSVIVYNTDFFGETGKEFEKTKKATALLANNALSRVFMI